MRETHSAPFARPRVAGRVQRKAADVGDARPDQVPVPRQSSCALCGDTLTSPGPHRRVRSPYGLESLLVCRTCSRVTLAEGYRPTA